MLKESALKRALYAVLVLLMLALVLTCTEKALASDKSFRKCVSCHTIEEGGRNKMGPNLWNIMNRGVGKMENYKYSKKFSAWAKRNTMWTPSLMDEWLTKSKSMVKGTKMNFREKKESKRAATIVYLRSMGVAKTEQGAIP